MHPYYLQQIKQIHVCMEQTANQNITHNLLNSNVEQLRLELGIDSSNSNWQTSQSAPYLTSCWLKDLFSFCADHNLTLQDDCTPLTLRTQNEGYLMESFLHHFDATDLKKLNHCQNFLQVITLSDISTANGTHLESAMVTGRSCLHPRSRLT